MARLDAGEGGTTDETTTDDFEDPTFEDDGGTSTGDAGLTEKSGGETFTSGEDTTTTDTTTDDGGTSTGDGGDWDPVVPTTGAGHGIDGVGTAPDASSGTDADGATDTAGEAATGTTATGAASGSTPGIEDQGIEADPLPDAPDQQGVESGSGSVASRARDLEQDLLSSRLDDDDPNSPTLAQMGLDASDVVVVRDGDTLRTQLTSRGSKKLERYQARLAEQSALDDLGLTDENLVRVERDEDTLIASLTEAGERTVAGMDLSERLAERFGPGGWDVGEDFAVQQTDDGWEATFTAEGEALARYLSDEDTARPATSAEVRDFYDELRYGDYLAQEDTARPLTITEQYGAYLSQGDTARPIEADAPTVRERLASAVAAEREGVEAADVRIGDVMRTDEGWTGEVVSIERDEPAEEFGDFAIYLRTGGSTAGRIPSQRRPAPGSRVRLEDALGGAGDWLGQRFTDLTQPYDEAGPNDIVLRSAIGDTARFLAEQDAIRLPGGTYRPPQTLDSFAFRGERAQPGATLTLPDYTDEAERIEGIERSAVRGGLEILNVPRNVAGLKEGVEYGGYLAEGALIDLGRPRPVSRTLSAADTAPITATADFSESEARAEASVERAGELYQAIETQFREKPVETGAFAAGALLGSGAIISGASRLSRRAGRAAAYGIQPGEELVGLAGYRATASLAGPVWAQRAFPNAEPVLISEEFGIRAARWGVRRTRANVRGAYDIARSRRGLRASPRQFELIDRFRPGGQTGELEFGDPVESTAVPGRSEPLGTVAETTAPIESEAPEASGEVRADWAEYAAFERGEVVPNGGVEAEVAQADPVAPEFVREGVGRARERMRRAQRREVLGGGASEVARQELVRSQIARRRMLGGEYEGEYEGEYDPLEGARSRYEFARAREAELEAEAEAEGVRRLESLLPRQQQVQTPFEVDIERARPDLEVPPRETPRPEFDTEFPPFETEFEYRRSFELEFAELEAEIEFETGVSEAEVEIEGRPRDRDRRRDERPAGPWTIDTSLYEAPIIGALGIASGKLDRAVTGADDLVADFDVENDALGRGETVVKRGPQGPRGPTGNRGPSRDRPARVDAPGGGVDLPEPAQGRRAARQRASGRPRGPSPSTGASRRQRRATAGQRAEQSRPAPPRYPTMDDLDVTRGIDGGDLAEREYDAGLSDLDKGGLDI